MSTGYLGARDGKKALADIDGSGGRCYTFTVGGTPISGLHPHVPMRKTFSPPARIHGPPQESFEQLSDPIDMRHADMSHRKQ